MRTKGNHCFCSRFSSAAAHWQTPRPMASRVSRGHHEKRFQATYQILPSAAAKLALAVTAVLKTKRLVEIHQVVMGDDRDPVGNLSFPNAVNIRLHQGATDLLALVLFQHSQRVNSNGTTTLLVTNGLSVLDGPPFALPFSRKLHGSVTDAGIRSTSGNDVADQCGRGLRIASLDDGKSEESQTELRATAQTVIELLSGDHVSYSTFPSLLPRPGSLDSARRVSKGNSYSTVTACGPSRMEMFLTLSREQRSFSGNAFSTSTQSSTLDTERS